MEEVDKAVQSADRGQVGRTVEQQKRWTSIPEFHQQRLLNNDKALKGVPKVCNVCYQAISKGKAPRFSTMHFPKALPEVDELLYFEERLVSIATPFAHIIEAPQSHNMQMKGNMVLVPSNFAELQANLPRRYDEHTTISTIFKRDLKLDRHWASGNTRPFYVARAMEELMKRPLYVSSNIVQRPDWEQDWAEDPEGLTEGPAHIDSEDQGVEDDGRRAGADALPESDTPPRQIKKESRLHSSCGSMKLEDITGGNQDTVLNNLPLEDANVHTEIAEDYLGKVLNIAPSQGSKPKSPLYMLHGEEKCFTKIYHGCTKYYCPTMNEGRIQCIRWRCAYHISNLFLSKGRCSYMMSNVPQTLRQGSIDDRRFTAGQVRKPSVMREILQSNIGHAALNKSKAPLHI